jgi:hypothetical protein
VLFLPSVFLPACTAMCKLGNCVWMFELAQVQGGVLSGPLSVHEHCSAGQAWHGFTAHLIRCFERMRVRLLRLLLLRVLRRALRHFSCLSVATYARLAHLVSICCAFYRSTVSCLDCQPALVDALTQHTLCCSALCRRLIHCGGC